MEKYDFVFVKENGKVKNNNANYPCKMQRRRRVRKSIGKRISARANMYNRIGDEFAYFYWKDDSSDEEVAN